MAGALDYAHKQSLLHRDVKPANIMLTHVDDDDLAAIIDRSHPLWTVKVGPLRAGNLPRPRTHTVTTAWFAGN